ncbi:MAG: HD domain-containing phosphohydrolase, partial [Spirochaetota bacterium]
HSYEFLQNIPWTPDMKNIPKIARWHHETLNGQGYPDKVERDQIPLQTQMMTIADVFDALTASDRPYKRAVPLERALEILKSEVELGRIDEELVNIFINARVYERAQKSNPESEK